MLKMLWSEWLQAHQSDEFANDLHHSGGWLNVYACSVHERWNCEDCVGECWNNFDVEITDPENAKVWVNVYLHDKAFGGREEGGWWYDTYQIEICVPTTLQYAKEVVSRLKEEYSNEGRRDIDSVLSEGIWEVWVELKPGENQPQRRPHYE